MALSENGWPCLEYGSPRLHTWIIATKQGDVLITMRNGSVGFILAFYISWYAQFIEPVIGKVLDDWGHAVREIRNGILPSNHYSGTAVDLNALKHVLGRAGTIVKIAALRAFVRGRLRGLIRLGADYHNRKDEMHAEAMPGKTMHDFEVRAKVLMKTKRGKRILNDNKSQVKVILARS
jgi:hypothetical protein